MEADEKDIEILRLLQRDAKISARDISDRVGSPITTVYSRIKRLEDSGIIKGYKPLLDAEKMGRPTTAFILASLAYRTHNVDDSIDITLKAFRRYDWKRPHNIKRLKRWRISLPFLLKTND